MKFFIALCLIACVAADTLPVAIVKHEMQFNPDGSYKQSFESADGVKVEESGKNKQISADAAGIAAQGSFSYTAPDGTVVKVTWVADENGFQPKGDHLPVAPPTPEHVVKLLADLKAAGKL